MTDGPVYVCAGCGAPCGPRDDWTEADADREAAELFTGILDAPEEETGMLCDVCQPQFMAWMHATYGPPPWPHRP